jgi:phospholipid/cholesterol/gamma-HCH transport system substrate-binding protein
LTWGRPTLPRSPTTGSSPARPTFDALNHHPAALRNLITAGETTFATTAANQNALSDVFNIFPTFLTQQRLTMAALKSFSIDADPVIRELIPVAQQLGPTLGALKTLSPYLRHLFVKLGPLITVSQAGLPATKRLLEGLGPNKLLDSVWPFLGQLNPILAWLGCHQQLISDFITNGGASLFARTTSFGGNGTGHYLRQFGPIGPETLSLQAKRDPNNRGNTYPAPLWLPSGNFAARNFAHGNIPAWDCRNTGAPGNGTTNGSPSQTGQPHGQTQQPCWVQPPVKGSPGQYKIPRLYTHTFSSR